MTDGNGYKEGDQVTAEQEKQFRSYGIHTVNDLIFQSEKNHVSISDAVAEFIAGFSQAWQEVKKELDAR